MAVTFITRIYATIDKSIDYIRRDKVVYRGEEAQELLRQEALQMGEDYLSNAVDYIERNKEVLEDDGKVEIKKTLTSTLHCTYNNATDEFRMVREMYEDVSSGIGQGKKDKELLGYHVWQSFSEKIDASISNEIGRKLAEELYGEHQCVISTHTNTEHTHNHIVFNAYKLDGSGKYNLDTTATRKLREVSDRLCEEYGLSVLEKTRNMNLRYYKDASGNKRWFEPTERKAQIVKGEFSKKTDYRNYDAYEKALDFKEGNWKTIRRDIDRFIPMSKSLDDLILHLQNIGYQIKNKNVKGGNLAYISFKPTGYDGFTRGKADTLGEEYTREAIIQRIASYQNKTVEEIEKNNEGGYVTDDETVDKSIGIVRYDYPNTDIENLNDEVRKRYSYKVKKWLDYPRHEVEKFIIADVKIMKKALNEMYADAMGYNKPTINYKGKQGRINYLEKCIRENLESLAFVENKNLQSFEQINENVRALQDAKIENQNNVSALKNLLSKMHESLVVVKKYNELKQRMEESESKADYIVFEKQGDLAMLRHYEEILKACKLNMPREQVAFSKEYEKFKEQYEALVGKLKEIKGMVDEYDKTVRVIDRIDRDTDRRYRAEIKKYYDIKKKKNKRKDSNEKNSNRDE